MSEQRHVILRQTIELEVARAEDAWPLQQELGRIASHTWPLIEACCDEISGAGRRWRFDRLEVDLGILDAQRLEEDLLARFVPALRAGLARAADRAGAPGVAEPAAGPGRQRELLAHFLVHGDLPWWADPSSGEPLADAFDAMLREDPHEFGLLLADLRDDPAALRRLALSFDDRRLHALLRRTAPEISGFVRALLAMLPSLSASAKTAQTMPLDLRNGVWQSLLACLARAGGIGADPLAAAQTVLAALAERSGVRWPGLIDRLGAGAGSDAEAGILQRLLARLDGAASRTSGPVERGPAARDELLAVRSAAGDEAQPDPATADAGGVRRAARAEKRQPPQAEPAAGQRAVGIALEGATNAATASLASRSVRGADRQPPIPAGRGFSDQAVALRDRDLAGVGDFSDVGRVFPGNAGLVILWPFLRRFFDRLGLLDEERFASTAAQQRAVALLQVLAAGDPAPVEYLLPLNKVLCGLLPQAVFELDRPIGEEEVGEADRLLEAVIAQLPVLDRMSIDGFRGSFLLRRGALEAEDSGWLLRVERADWDLLLDRFPWTFEWVRLPWMEAPLRVEWR